MFEFDELKIYKGYDIPITSKISVKQPTLEEITDFGEKQYFNAVYTLTCVAADMKWQLWDIGKIDYTTISDYDLFVIFLSQLLSQEVELDNGMKKNPLELILKNINFADFQIAQKDLGQDHKQCILYNESQNIVIDKFVYTRIVEAVRKIHYLKRNNEIPANEKTKMDLIEDAKDEAMLAKSKPYKSLLVPLISTISVTNGLCGDDKIWNMPISRFLYDVKKTGHIQHADLLLKGAYSGFGSLKGIDPKQIDIFADI